MFWTNNMMQALRQAANRYRLNGWGEANHLGWHRGRVSAAAVIEATSGIDADDLAYLAAINEAHFLTTTYQKD